MEQKIDGLIEDITDLSVDFHNHYYSVTTNNTGIKMMNAGAVMGTGPVVSYSTGTYPVPFGSYSTQFGEQDDSN
jgi:hypothetical protein